MTVFLATGVRTSLEVWDLLVVLSICTGFVCSIFTESTNSSLAFVWIVFLCDLVYITDALARRSKQLCRWTILSWLSSVFVNRASSFPTLKFYTNAAVILSCVPYHFLVVLGWDGYVVYLPLCVFRAVTVAKSGRITAVNLAS